MASSPIDTHGTPLVPTTPVDDTAAPRSTGAVAGEGQHSLPRILGIWAAAALSMAILGWVVAPAIGDRLDLGVGALQFVPLQALWETIFPFLDEPATYSFAEIMESDARKEALEGAWQLLGLFVVLGIFNSIIGEELLFRGVLLPKMGNVFGKHDWIANGLLFGLHHLHQPWGIFSSIVDGVFLYAWPSRRFRSAWYGIIVHSMQTVVFVVLALGLVLGLG